ncbi:MAG: hypothetical protein Q7W55_09680 [Pseudohongiella sp.]|nr:hypothetical protein [Pseudohongiella sp.]
MSKRSLGTLTVDLILKMGGFTEGMDSASRATKQNMREIQKAVDASAQRVKNFVVAGAAAITAGLAISASLVNASRVSIDANAKLARSLDGTTDGLRALRIAASDSGLENMESSLNRLNQNLGAVEMNGGPALETVKALNLDMQAMADMDIDEKVAYIADGIRDYGGSARESAEHLKRLGFEQESAIELFRAGGDAIRSARGEVNDYGLSLSEIDARKVELANDAISRMKLAQEGLIQQITAGISPLLVGMAEQWNEYSKGVVGNGAQVEEMLDRFIVGGINTAAAFRSGAIAIKNLVEDLWGGYQTLPSWAQEVGVAGAIIGGKKGVMVLAGISYALKDLQTSVEWFKMYQEGAIDFQALVNTSPNDARRIMEQLGREIGDYQIEGPSIIETLFGAPSSEESREWANELIDGYKKMRDEVTQRATALNNEFQGLSPVEDPRTSGADDPELKRQAELNRLYLHSEESMRRQIELFGKESETALMFYELQHGSLKELNEEQQERLLGLAHEFEQMKELSEQENIRRAELEKQADQITEFGSQAARNIQTQFADYLFDPFDDGVKGMLKNFGNMIRRMSVEVASAKALNFLFGGLASSSNPILAGLGSGFAGMFDSGGMIPAGGWGIVGEIGPEIVRGPATVTSRQDTARTLGGSTQIVINNLAPGVQVTRSAERFDGGRRVLELTVKALADAADTGQLDPIMAIYGATRRGR